MIGAGAILVSIVDSAWQFLTVYGLVIGLFGNAALFSPLVANVTRWFARYRGVAVGLVTAGQSVAGAAWPPLFEYGLGAIGWRDTYLVYGLFGVAAMTPLSFLLRLRLRLRGRPRARPGPRSSA